MEIKVGGVYKCGDTYVKCLCMMQELEPDFPTAYYSALCVECTIQGVAVNCKVGMFGVGEGDYYIHNTEDLQYDLKSVKTEQEIKIEELQSTIDNAKESITMAQQQIELLKESK